MDPDFYFGGYPDQYVRQMSGMIATVLGIIADKK